ncbi:MAG: phosphoribosylanthranilate isomerase [Rhodospirillales bacterium]
MTILVKICGLNSADTVDTAVKAGTDMVGFNFFPKSPRYVDPDTAGGLAGRVPDRVIKVGLFVEPTDDELAAMLTRVPLDMIQLHGQEDPARVAHVRDRFAKPVMKVIGVSDAADLSRAAGYKGAADRLLLDAKPPKGADRPGGNAVSFDWTMLSGWTAPMPWMLAGGLNPGNVAEAVSISHAPGVDVASGVESAPGVKDNAAIKAFIDAARVAAPVKEPGLFL